MLTRRTLLAFLAVLPVIGVLRRAGRAATGREQDSTSMQAQMQAAAEGSVLSAQMVQELERQLAVKPNNLILRSQLLGYYLLYQKGTARHVRQQHILWLIRHAPTAWITGSPFALLTPHEDASVLAEAQQVWEQQTQAHPQNAQLLGNAAAFYTLRNANAAERLYEQAQRLEPTNPHWAEALGQLFYRRIPDRTGTIGQHTAQQALAHFETWDRYTTEAEKTGDYSALANMAMAAFEAQAFGKARTYAKRLLDIAGHDPTAGNSVHHGNVVLGRLALHDGELAKARAYLLASGRIPGSPQLDSFGPNMTLAKDLLAKGERQAVLDYFRLCSKFWNDRALKQWTAEVKNGEIPEFGPHLLY